MGPPIVLIINIVKIIIVGVLLLVISYFFARAIYAQLCTTLTIPFKKMDDMKIYDTSVKKLPNKLILILATPLAISGSIAFTSSYDTGYSNLIIFIVCICFYVISASIISFRLFKKTIVELGQEWPPKQSSEN